MKVEARCECPLAGEGFGPVSPPLGPEPCTEAVSRSLCSPHTRYVRIDGHETDTHFRTTQPSRKCSPMTVSGSVRFKHGSILRGPEPVRGCSASQRARMLTATHTRHDAALQAMTISRCP